MLTSVNSSQWVPVSSAPLTVDEKSSPSETIPGKEKRSWRELAGGIGRAVKENWGAITLGVGAALSCAALVNIGVVGCQSTALKAAQNIFSTATLYPGAGILLYGIDVLSDRVEQLDRCTSKRGSISLGECTSVGLDTDRKNSGIELSTFPIEHSPKSDDPNSWTAWARSVGLWCCQYKASSLRTKIAIPYNYFKYDLGLVTHILVLGALNTASDQKIQIIAKVAAAAIAGPWVRFVGGQIASATTSLYHKVIALCSSRAVSSAPKEAPSKTSLYNRVKNYANTYKVSLLFGILGGAAIILTQQPVITELLSSVQGLAMALFQVGVVFATKPVLGPPLYSVTHLKQNALFIAAFLVFYKYCPILFATDEEGMIAQLLACIGMGTVLGAEAAGYAQGEIPMIEIPDSPPRTPFSKLGPLSASCRIITENPGTLVLLGAAGYFANPGGFSGTIMISIALMSYHLRYWKRQSDIGHLMDRWMLPIFTASTIMGLNGNAAEQNPTILIGFVGIGIAFGLIQYQREAAKSQKTALMPAHAIPHLTEINAAF